MKKKSLKILLFIMPLVLAVMVPIVAAGSVGFNGVMNAYLKLIDERSPTVIDRVEIEKNLIKGALSGTDKYSYFQEVETYKSQNDEFHDANFVGIGVSMTDDEKGVYVNSVFLNSPAYKAGLKPGDIIFSVNGTSIAGKSLAEVAALIKGPINTTVDIGVIDRDKGVEKILTLTRDKIDIKTVAYTMYDGAAYIRITGFTDKTGIEFEEVLDKVDKAGVDRLVLDLRNNGGGTVRGCIEVARQLLSEETIVKLEFRYGGYLDIRYTASENDRSYDIVVIINENTASASEILAAAIRDNNRGKLVGETTFGKSLVQASYQILTQEAYEKYSALTGETNMYVVIRTVAQMGITPDEKDYLGAVKLTIGEYITPGGDTINNSGIVPDAYIDYNGPVVFDDIPDREIFVYDKYDVGMSSEEVKKAKRILDELGYDAGEITGYYDESAFAAVKAFQADEGLYPYGILDYTTQYALNNRMRLFEAESDAQLMLAYIELEKLGDE